MKGKARISLLVMLMVITSCVPTRFSNIWVDETYQKHPINDVLVMAIFPTPERSKMIEDEMARQLRLRGVNTVLGYVEFPGKQPNEDEVMSRLNRSGLDAVLVTKFFKREYQLIGNPNDPWNPANPEPYDIIQTNLYDVKTKRKIWSALSETWIKSMDSYVTSSIVGAVLKKLADDKFVK